MCLHESKLLVWLTYFFHQNNLNGSNFRENPGFVFYRETVWWALSMKKVKAYLFFVVPPFVPNSDSVSELLQRWFQKSLISWTEHSLVLFYLGFMICQSWNFSKSDHLFTKSAHRLTRWPVGFALCWESSQAESWDLQF